MIFDVPLSGGDVGVNQGVTPPGLTPPYNAGMSVETTRLITRIPTILTSSGSPLMSPPHKINKRNQKIDVKDLFRWKLLFLSPDLKSGRDLERFELGLSSGNAILTHFVMNFFFLKGVSYFFDVF